MARIESFIATGTRLVIRQSKALACQWYETKKEIVLDPQTVSEVQCPMGTGAKVSRITYQGIEVYFPPLVTRSRLVLEDGDIDGAAFKQAYSMVAYDIPSNSPYPNPSSWLRFIGVRDQLSGWLVKKGAISTARQIEMMDAGVRLTIRDFAEYETAAIVKDIVRSMYDEARVLAASVGEREAGADEYLRTAQEEGITEQVARKNYENRMKSIAKDTEEKVKAMAAAAKNFGFAGACSFVNLQQVSAIAATTKSEMVKKARAYKQAATVLAAVGTVEATAMAAQMTDVFAGDVPVEVVADMLIDAGKDTEAAALQQAHGTGAFGAVLDAHNAPTVALEDDGTFSLDEDAA